MEQEKIIPKFRLLRLSDHKYWDDDIKNVTKDIYAVYAYNESRHVHICSFEPTYEIRYLYHDYEYLPGLELSDDERE